MALSGLHVEFSYAVGPGDERVTSALKGEPVQSQTITNGQQTDPGPGGNAVNGTLVAHLHSSEAGFYAVNKAANTNPRGYLAADTPIDIFIPSKATISWVTA